MNNEKVNLLPATTTGMKPKPTRAEIVEALTILQMEKLNSELAAMQTEADTLSEEATLMAVSFVASMISKLRIDFELGSFYQEKITQCYLQVKLGNDEVTPELRRAIRAAQAARNRVPREPKIDVVRERIRDSLKPDSSLRIQALIDSSRPALEATLATMNKS